MATTFRQVADLISVFRRKRVVFNELAPDSLGQRPYTARHTYSPFTFSAVLATSLTS